MDNGERLSRGVRLPTSETTLAMPDFGEWVVRVQACNAAGCGKPNAKRFTVEPLPNRAPQVNTDAVNYAGFVGTGNAPRGVIVSKPFHGIFSDPDGDQLTYYISAISVPDGRIEHELGIFPDGQSDASAAQSDRSLEAVMRVFFQADAEADWDAMDPPVPEQPVVSFTLTAIDPGGLAASAAGSFVIPWEHRACELTAPSSVSGLGIERGAVISWTVPDDLGEDCEVTGFVVGATDSNGVDWETSVADPEARKYVLRGLDPGDYRFYSRIVYGDDGASDELKTALQTVPAACDIALTAEPYGSTMIGGRWSTNHGTPSGCVFGPTIELQIKRSQDDYYHKYGLFPNWPQRDPNLPAFIIGDMEPYVSYDFKIVAVNAAGERGESNVATAMIVTDPSVTPDDNSPLNLRVRTDNNGSIHVSWSAPASFGPGRTFAAWDVEWTELDDDGNAAATTTAALVGPSETSHRIDNLVDGTTYIVRVAARTTDTANNTHSAWSASSPAVTVLSEPLQAWLYNESHGAVRHLSDRIWMSSSANKNVVSAVCSVNANSNSVPCPPGTLVNLVEDGQLALSLTVQQTDADQAATLAESDGEAGGPPAPRIGASGGNGRLWVGWTDVASDADHKPYLGTVNGYFVESRQGTSGTWSQTLIGSTARGHTLGGLTNGVSYQVRVRGRSANLEDHDNDPDSPDQTVHYNGFTSGIVTVQTHGLSTQPSRWPDDVRIMPGEDDRTLIVTWEPPEEDDRSRGASAYQVRHRLRGSSDAWTESAVLFPLPTRRMCDQISCLNPRRYVIEDLVGGRDYVVGIRARNANGWSDWLHLRSNLPNGIPPAFSSAAVNGTSLTITFDEALHTSSVPAGSAFTVNATSGTTTRSVGVSTVALSGSSATLTLSSAVVNAETVVVSYTKPATAPLVDEAGNAVESFTEQLVANNTPV